MDNSQIDLSKVISVITENPDLIMKISSLLGKGGESNGENDREKPDNEEDSTEAENSKAEETVNISSEITTETAEPKNRQNLLSAFRPYLSEGRARALDSVLTIANVFEKIRGK